MENDEPEAVDTSIENNDVESEAAPEGQVDDPTATLTPEQQLAKATAEAAKYRRLYEKGKKAPVVVSAPATNSNPPAADVDERILKAQGMSDELLTTLKKVASLNGTSLIDAQTDDLFVAAKEKFEKAQKSRAASMGASRGSGSPAPKKDLGTPGLSREEHKKLVQAK